jgi:ribosomal protein S18 acetylase RimI-like enzyme
MNSVQGRHSQHEVSRLEPASLPIAEETLAFAFEQDPMTPYVFPRAADAHRKLKAVFGVELRGVFHPGVVEQIGDGKAVALWLPPGGMKGALIGMLGSGALFAPFWLGLGAMWRGTRLLRTVQRIHSRSVSGDHWYLLALGVHPQHQGQGWGSTLLRHGLARAQSLQLPTYLETTNQRNLAFYQQHGFKLVGQRPVARDGPMVWGMLCPGASMAPQR